MSVEVSIRDHSLSETGRTMLRTYTLEQPDGRQDIYRVDVIDAKLDGIVDALSLVLKHAFPKKKQEPSHGQQHGNGG